MSKNGQRKFKTLKTSSRDKLDRPFKRPKNSDKILKITGKIKRPNWQRPEEPATKSLIWVRRKK